MNFISNFLVVAGQVVTLFLLMGVGYALARLGKLSTEGVSQMSFITLYIVSPCVIIVSFAVERSAGLTERLLQFALVYGLCTLLNLVVSSLCFRGQPEGSRGPLRFGMAYGNNGFMGLPLVGSIFGPGALIYGVTSVALFNFTLWTHGVKTMGGKITPRQALVNPATVGMAVGLTLFFTGWRLPSMVGNAVGFLADLNTPLAMVVIGAQMAGANLKSCVTNPKLYAVALYRLILSPLVPMVLLLPFHLDPMLYCTCVVMCAVPVAGATGMLAQRFGRDTATAAELVTLTTLLSVVTLPVMAVAAQMLGGL